MFGTQDIILLGVIVVVLFGATKLPQLGSGVGQAIRNFKKSMSEVDEIESTSKDDSKNKKEKASEKEAE